MVHPLIGQIHAHLAQFLNTISYPAADPEEIVDLTSIVNAIAKLRIDVENQVSAKTRGPMMTVELTEWW